MLSKTAFEPNSDYDDSDNSNSYKKIKLKIPQKWPKKVIKLDYLKSFFFLIVERST